MIESASTIRKYIGVNLDFDISVLTPHFTWAYKTYLQDLLGYDLFLIYDSSIQNNENIDILRTGDFLKLELVIDELIVYIGMFDWMNISGVSISELGLQRIEGDVSGLTRKSAFQYQEKNAKEYFRNKGFNAMETVMKYIMGNLALYPEFVLSVTCKSLTGSIFPNTAMFDKYYNINKSMLLFIKMKQYIREAELFDIAPSIGMTFLNRIKTSLDNVDIIALLPELRNAIAYKAIAKGIETSSINIADDGARLVLRA